MARSADVQYVQYRVDGTAARKAEQVPETSTPVYTRPRAQRRVIAVDPVALVGIVVSAVVVIAMAIGLVQYRQNLNAARQMSQYVQQLQQENQQLEANYKAGYDLEQIRDIALEAGMVPAENQQRIRVYVQQPEQEQTRMSFWDTLTTFLAGIFA